MASLDTTNVKTALRGLKGQLEEIFKALPGSGNVLGRIRYANDIGEWLKIAAVERVAGVQVIRCVFIYFRGWATQPIEGRTNNLLSPTYSIEIIQGFEDGTDEDNSTLRFEDFLADAIGHFIKDPYLGFTEGAEVLHDGLDGGEGDGRPQYVDGILAHRKVATVTVHFKLCK